jgi:hypothetical protein
VQFPTIHQSRGAAPLILVLILAGLGALVLALFFGQSVGSGNYRPVLAILGGFFGLIIFLTLNQRYWYTIPFALASSLPAVPLGGRTVESGELIIVACTAIFLARLALKKEHLVLFRPAHIPFLLFFGWVCWVWFLNPTGMVFFGSDTMGGRYYLKMVLGFCAFVILASQRPTSQDVWWIIGLLLFGICLGSAWQLFQFFFGGGGSDEIEGENFYSWHQVLSPPATALTAFLFARYKPSEIFSIKRPLLLAFYCLAIFLVLFSGKRMGLAIIFFIPMLSIFLYRQYRYAVVAGCFGLLGMALVINLQGTHINLPLTVQRTMSWIPAEWDPALETLGTADKFRESLRHLAWQQIQRNPWVGSGYAINLQEVVSSIDVTGHRDLGYEKTMGAALVGNWHNRTLGYWADFGFPIVPLAVAMLIVAIITSYKLVQFFPHGSSYQMFCAFAFYAFLQFLVTSHTSGHTASDMYKTWWIYGLLFALAAVAKKQKRQLSINPASNIQNSTLLPIPLPLPNEPLQGKNF